MAVTEEKILNKIQFVNSDGVLVKRDFKAIDDKIAALETATKVATTETQGIVELATNEETATGSDSTRAVTPASLKHTLDPIIKKLENVSSGVTNFAYKDYTQAEHQGEMEVGVVYLVPFNKSNQFIKLDPETNAPADDQAPEVAGDTDIAYYVKCIKDSSGSVTANDKIYTQGHLENVAYTNLGNTFSVKNTFESGVAVTGGIDSDTVHATGAVTLDGTVHVSGAATFDTSVTVTGDLTASKGIDVASGSGSAIVPNAGQVKTYVDGFIPEIKPESSFGTDSASLVPGKIYFYYEE